MQHVKSLEGAMESHSFKIQGRFYKNHCFPSLNDYIKEIGKNPLAGGRMKKDYEMMACNAIRLGLKRYKPSAPVVLHYYFKEPRKGNKRDLMNVFSFADKVIEDALQICKVIPDDGPDVVQNTTHAFEYTDGIPEILVVIEEV